MNKDMITEDEFKDLTDSLETVGHYDPSVKDMLDHIQSSPVKWAGFSVEYATRLSEGNSFKQEIEKVKALNIPGIGRFEKAIWEFAENLDKFYPLVEERGMRLEGGKGEIILVKDPK